MRCALSSAACQRQQQQPRCQPSRRRFVSAKGADGCEQHAAHADDGDSDRLPWLLQCLVGGPGQKARRAADRARPGDGRDAWTTATNGWLAGWMARVDGETDGRRDWIQSWGGRGSSLARTWREASRAGWSADSVPAQCLAESLPRPHSAPALPAPVQPDAAD